MSRGQLTLAPNLVSGLASSSRTILTLLNSMAQRSSPSNLILNVHVQSPNQYSVWETIQSIPQTIPSSRQPVPASYLPQTLRKSRGQVHIPKLCATPTSPELITFKEIARTFPSYLYQVDPVLRRLLDTCPVDQNWVASAGLTAADGHFGQGFLVQVVGRPDRVPL